MCADGLPTLMGTREAGEWLKLSQEQVRRLCVSGDLPAIRIGTLWRIKVDALLERMKENAA